MDNTLVVDQWSSLTALANTGAVSMALAGGYYDLMVEYRHVAVRTHPETLNPKPETRNLKPEIRNLKIETRNLKPVT